MAHASPSVTTHSTSSDTSDPDSCSRSPSSPRLAIQDWLRSNTLHQLRSSLKVKTSRHAVWNNLVSLKYTSASRPSTDTERRLIAESRGLVLDEDNDLAVVAFPYERFFNYGEPQAAKIDWSTARVMEKLDGCLMTLYLYDGAWQVASSGMPDAGGLCHHANDTGGLQTVGDLFWEVWKSNGYELPDPDLFKKEKFCFMFELMSTKQLVTAPIRKEDVVLHGARNLKTFEEVSPEKVAKKFGWTCVAYKPSLSSLNQVREAANGLGLSDEHPEGFVVCDAQFNRIKVKNPEFVILSHLPPKIRLERTLDAQNNLAFRVRSFADIVRKNAHAKSDAEFLSYQNSSEWNDLFIKVSQRFDQVCDRVQMCLDGKKDRLSFGRAEVREVLQDMKSKKIGDAVKYFSSIKDTENLIALMNIDLTAFEIKQREKREKSESKRAEVDSTTSTRVSPTINGSQPTTRGSDPEESKGDSVSESEEKCSSVDTQEELDEIVSHKAKVIQHITQSAETHFFDSRPSMDLIQARTQAQELLASLSVLKDQYTLREFGSVGYGLDSASSDYDLLAVKRSDVDDDEGDAVDAYFGGDDYLGIDLLSSVAEEIDERKTCDVSDDVDAASYLTLTSVRVVRRVFDAATPRLVIAFDFTSSMSESTSSADAVHLEVDLTVSEQDDSSESTLKELAFADEIKAIVEDDIRIATFLVFVKKWAKDRKIHDTTEGTIGGFGWALMGIFALRHAFGTTIKLPVNITVGELLVKFFEIMSNFMSKRDELSMDVVTGQYAPNQQHYALFVKNPLEPERNITNCVRAKGAQQIADAVKIENSSFKSPYAQIAFEADYDVGSSWGQRKALTDEELKSSSLYQRKFRDVHDEDSDIPTIRVMQFNTLADCLAASIYDKKAESAKNQTGDDEAKCYEYRCPPDVLTWSARREQLLEEITRFDPDIVCLEEVDHFSDFFEPRLRECGYLGIYEPKRASRDRRPKDGVAIFYRASRFAPLGSPHRTALTLPSGKSGVHVGMVVPLQLIGCGAVVKDIVVACTHLKSGQFFEMEKIRRDQVLFLLNEIASLRGKSSPVILCGDLNAHMTTVPNVKALMYPALLQHDLGLRSSYQPVGDPSNPSAQSSYYTFYPGQTDCDVRATYDYIFHSRSLRTVRVLKTPRSFEIDHEVRLPNANYPSDHFMICADFQFKDVSNRDSSAANVAGSSNSKKRKKKGKGSKSNAENSSTQNNPSTKKLRPSWDVYNRLKWNAAQVGVDLDDVYIGYHDSRRGDTEVPFQDFVPIKNGGDIPFHHVFYFRVATRPSKIIWHRDKRIDLVFGSSADSSEKLSDKS